MAYLLLPIEQLEADTNNVRRDYGNILELAESIAQHGLLQNLVVERAALSDTYVVRAGNRRLKALQLLASQGRWDSLVPCLENSDELAQVVENIHREDVTPWSLGFRYMEVVERGISIRELAEALNKPYGHVSLHINIARCIHPDAQRLMEKIGSKLFTKKHLGDLARFVEPVSLEPQREVQIGYIERLTELENHVRGNKLKGKGLGKKSQVMFRFARLKKGEVEIPPGMEPFVRAIVDYLDGCTVNVRVVTVKPAGERSPSTPSSWSGPGGIQ